MLNSPFGRPFHNFKGKQHVRTFSTRARFSRMNPISSDWSPDGATIAIGTTHAELLYVKLRENAVERITAKNPYRADVHWSPKGDAIAVEYVTHKNQGAGGTKLWLTNDAKLLRNLNGNLGPITWSPNGEVLAVITDSIDLWNIRSGQQADRLKHPDARSLQAAWSPDGTRIASVDSDQKIRVWDIASRSVIATVESSLLADFDKHAIAFSPDGHWLACTHQRGSFEITLTVWDTE